MFILLLATSSSCRLSVLFRIVALLFQCFSLALKVGSVVLLVDLFFPNLEVAYNKVISFISLSFTCSA